MPSLSTLAIIAVAGAVLYALGLAALDALKGSGRSQERADRAERDLSLAHRQSQTMVAQKGPDDAAKDLDAGNF